MHDGIMTLHCTWASLTLPKHMTRQITRYYYASSKSAWEPTLKQFKQSTQILFWKGSGRDPPDYRCATGWKHDAGPIPLPCDGICGDSWSCMETSRNPHSQRDALRWNCPMDFPVGCHVTVALSHYMHTGRDETICLHNWKGVIFKPDEHSPDIICIPTKSLAAYHPNKSKHDQLIWQWWITQSRADGIWSPNLQSIDQLDKTKNFPVADGFVGFTRMFWYLGFGSLISYNLREDDNITARIVATNTSRDAQKVVWHNPHLDLQSHSNELAPSYPQET